jgi:heat shock protein HslJ
VTSSLPVSVLYRIEKLNVSNTVEAVQYAGSLGLIQFVRKRNFDLTFLIFIKNVMMKTFLVSLVVLLLTFTSCRHDQTLDANGILYTWEAKSFMSLESVAYPKNENKFILLTFKNDGTYSLKLDINSCGGRYTLDKNNQIEIESPACTEACCDSKFSEKLASMISRVTTYEIEGNTLKLNVPQWGYIECEIFSSSLINPNP